MDRIKKVFTDVTNSLSRDNRTAQQSANESFLNQKYGNENTMFQRGQEVLYKVKKNANEFKEYAFENVSKHAQQAKEATGNFYTHAKERTSNLYENVKTTASKNADKIKENTVIFKEKTKDALVNYGGKIKSTASSAYDGAKQRMPDVSESNKAKIQNMKSAMRKKVKEVHEFSTSFNQYIGEKIIEFKDTVLNGSQTRDNNISVNNVFMQLDGNGFVVQDDSDSVEQAVWEETSEVGEMPDDKFETTNLAGRAVKEALKSEVNLVVNILKQLCDETDELKISDSAPVIQSTSHSVHSSYLFYA